MQKTKSPVEKAELSAISTGQLLCTKIGVYIKIMLDCLMKQKILTKYFISDIFKKIKLKGGLLNAYTCIFCIAEAIANKN